MRGDVGDLGLHFSADLAQLLSEIDDRIDGQRKDEARPERKFGVPVDDQPGQADHGQRVLYDPYDFGQARTDQVHVADDAGHEHADTGLAEEVEGQADDLGEQFVAQPFKHFDAAVGHQELLDEQPDPLGHENPDQQQWDEDEGRRILFDEDFVEGRLHEVGRPGRAQGHDAQGCESGQDMQLEGGEIPEAAPEELDGLIF